MIKRIIKRDGRIEDFKEDKIIKAVQKTFKSLSKELSEKDAIDILKRVLCSLKTEQVYVEEVQDKVEEALMQLGFFDVAKSYIIYRNSRTEARNYRDYLNNEIEGLDLRVVLKSIEKDFPEEEYSLIHLINKYKSFVSNDFSNEEKIELLIKAAIELTSKDAPKWEYIASRLYETKLGQAVKIKCKKLGLTNFYKKVKYLVEKDLYGDYLLDFYSEEEINRCEKMLVRSRDKLISYSSLELLYKRYLVKDLDGELIESPQEMFLSIAMHLGMKEKDKLIFVKKLYDVLSKFEFILSTPTLMNARRPNPQLASCFVDSLDDSLDSIFKTITNFSKISQRGGGMGIYFGKVRASGSKIKGNFKTSNGVLNWLKIVNEVAGAVNQYGIRNGAVACYLDVWHKDLPEFLQLKTKNNEDKLIKTYEIYPSLCYPDYFWKLSRDNINALWYLMDPHEIYSIKKFHLEDYYGEEWENKYLECVHDERISKREISIKEIIRLIIKSVVETGTPFCFNRDTANKLNPNNHAGMIYCSNLCGEIIQNSSHIKNFEHSVINTKFGEVIVEKNLAGDLATANLGSLCLGNIDLHSDIKLERIIETAIRALDNAIDLNVYPVEYSKQTAFKYRAIGLGVNGYQEILAKNLIYWESEEHINFANSLFEKINYFALKASNKIAEEKGSYHLFKGSDFETGSYFKKRNYTSEKWQLLADEIKKNGLRNGYLLAISPTSSSSILASTTPGVNPLVNAFYFEEKAGNTVPRVAPNLNEKTIECYKSAYDINQLYSLKAAAIRQKHIDQSQTVSLYITNEYSMRQLLELYIKARELNLKTLYYVRTKPQEFLND